MKITHFTYLVRNYDDAILWFTSVLGFVVVEDTDLGAGKRWVLVGPEEGGVRLLLGKAASPDQAAFIGKQGGGRVFLFLNSDNFTRDYEMLQARGVHFLEQPRHESYGSVVVFEDLYGNRWDLIQQHSV